MLYLFSGLIGISLLFFLIFLEIEEEKKMEMEFENEFISSNQ